MTEGSALMTVSDVMAELRLGRTAVYRLIKTRELPSIIIGGSRRFPRKQFHDWIDALARPIAADA